MSISRLRESDGFTLIELMVVVLIIATLVAIAIPTFLGFRTRAQDEAVKATLNTAEKAAKLLLVGEARFPSSAALLAALPSAEPSITWLGHQTSSTGPSEVSIDQDNGSQLNFASRSNSGACFYLRTDLEGHTARMVDPSAASCEAHDYEDGPDTGW